MNISFCTASVSALFTALLSLAALPVAAQPSTDGRPSVQAEDDIAAGRYLVSVGGCNDCHTENYLFTGGNVPEEEWLTGSIFGWQGEWGTTWPQNLRLRAQEWSEDEWVSIMHTRTAMPPMPWQNVNQMSDKDARAIYRYLRWLGPKGELKPTAIPPGVQPETPYLSLMPQNLPEAPPVAE